MLDKVEGAWAVGGTMAFSLWNTCRSVNCTLVGVPVWPTRRARQESIAIQAETPVVVKLDATAT